MSRLKQLIDDVIYSGNNEDGNSFFKRAEFSVPYVGSNTFGQHDDMLIIRFWEPYSNENIRCTTFNEPVVRSLITPQVHANRLPSSLTDPDFYRDVYEYRDGNVTHSFWAWDRSISAFEIDLKPVYEIQKACFVLHRETEILHFHELFLLVNPIPY